ncbi:MAG: hypothetical protein ACLUI3_01055 [Christensenellales bacterium]
MTGATALCQQMLDEGGISDVRLYTDAPYAQAEGLEVVSARRGRVEREPRRAGDQWLHLRHGV